MRQKISDTQRYALRLLARQEVCAEIGRWPLGLRTVIALRRMGLSEPYTVTEHSEPFRYNFGRYVEYRTVPRAYERITDAGRKVVGG